MKRAFTIALLVELTMLLVGWMLRIRGIRGPEVTLGVQVPAILAMGWFYLRYFRYRREERRPIPRDPVLILLTLVVVFVVPLAGLGETGTWARKLTFMFVVAVVVFGEELFYRGILQAYLERSMHPLAAILLANVGFIACHAGVMDINALSISIIGAAGVLSGVVFQITRSLVWPTILHLAGDWILVVPMPVVFGSEALVALNALAVLALALWWWRLRARWREPATPAATRAGP
jgi:membrane protease YdiL (CAAX protease family)